MVAVARTTTPAATRRADTSLTGSGKSNTAAMPKAYPSGRDSTQAASLEVLERLAQLVLRVHHERAVPGDRLADGLTAEEQHVHGLAGVDLDRAALPEHGQLAGLDRVVVAAHGASAGQHVHERVVVLGPRQL